MPRIPKKKENLAELGLDGCPTKLTLEYLRGLNRTQIQALAKRYSVRANLKTDEVIKQLVVKEEQNEPNLVRTTIRKGKATQKALGQRKTPVDSVPETGAQNTEGALGTDNVVDSDNASTDSHVDKPRLSRRRATPYLSAKEREALKKQGSSKKTLEVAKSVDQEPLINPTVKDVRDVRRLLATLNEERVGMKKDVEDTKFILAAAQRALAVATDKAKAISWRRELYEREILPNMKSNRTLWDGTPHMALKDRKTWVEFLDGHWKPSRRPDDESSEDEIDEEQGRDGDNEMSDDGVPSGQPAPQLAPQAMEEVDYDDIYV